MDLEDHTFRREDLALLGLEAGGTYETVVIVDSDGDPLVKPLGLHVTSCGLFVTVFLPSKAFGRTQPGDRMFVSVPTYADVGLFGQFLSGDPVDDPANQPFERGTHPRVPNLPGFLVEVATVEEGTIGDARGTVGVRHLYVKPLLSVVPRSGWTPICRAYGSLVEAAIALTRGESEDAAAHLRRASGTAPYHLIETIRSMETLI